MFVFCPEELDPRLPPHHDSPHDSQEASDAHGLPLPEDAVDGFPLPDDPRSASGTFDGTVAGSMDGSVAGGTVDGAMDMPRLEEAERNAERTAKAAFDTANADEAAKEVNGVDAVDAANLDDNYFAATPDSEAEAAAEAEAQAEVARRIAAADTDDPNDPDYLGVPFSERYAEGTDTDRAAAQARAEGAARAASAAAQRAGAAVAATDRCDGPPNPTLILTRIPILTLTLTLTLTLALTLP